MKPIISLLGRIGVLASAGTAMAQDLTGGGGHANSFDGDGASCIDLPVK